MTAPLPQDAPGYNTTSRPRPRKSKFFSPPKDLEGFYSPFWPLVIVFISIMTLMVYQISFLRHRAMVLDMQIKRLAGPVQKASAEMVFIQDLRADLTALAPQHPSAAVLVKEFFSTVPLPATDSTTETKTSAPDATLPSAPASGTALPPATAPPHPPGK